MIDSRLLSEEDSAKLTGISLGTLNRFADAGYLQVQCEKDGERYFSRAELDKLFGAPPKEREENVEVVKDLSIRQSTTDKMAAVENSEDFDGAFLETSDGELDAAELNVEEESSAKPVTEVEELALSPVATPASELLEDVTDYSEETEPVEVKANATTEKSAAPGDQERTIITLQNVVNLQDRLLEEREANIASLQEQVQWLRQRVENFEQKADRDQLLLLSETQALARLITRDRKKSSVQHLLEWVGIKKKESEPGSTIEISRT